MKHITSYRTAESVSPKHPDKLCDQISDAILDAYLAIDPKSRVAMEACGGHGQVFLTGEITSTAKNIDFEQIAHRIAGDDVEVMVNVVKQSPEIAQGVDTGGAGDQGIMIGYACDETPEMLPREVVLSRRLNQFIFAKHPYDGKTQVTLCDNTGKCEVESIVASFQNTSQKELEELVQAFIEQESLTGKLELHLNPAGDWSQGGFDARRVAVDYLQKYQAKEVFVRLAYAIGYAEPLERSVIIDGKIEQIEGYDLTPRGIIKHLDLLRPIYEPTARYGHFGEGFGWDS